MKLHAPFVQLPLLFDAEALCAEVMAIPESSWRPHPQGYPGNSALTLITTHGDPESNELGGAMLPTPHLERCPYLMQAMEAIGATWGRTRLMRLSGQAEVSPHIDVNYYWRERHRVHVPILTQPTVSFHCGDDQINMAAGECWIFDTWRLHKVINDAERSRIHLVADTVGGEGFWSHVQNGRSPGKMIPGWQAQPVMPAGDRRPKLDYESVNLPQVMSPWELREHFVFMLGEAERHPELEAAHKVLLRLARHWHALWSCYGERSEGWPRYRKLLDRATKEMQAQCPSLKLTNGLFFISAVYSGIFEVALADRASLANADADVRPATNIA